ncbi:MAG: hypothetical protein ACKN9V_02290, partial [Pseudomonadota bacterium]
MMSLYLSIGLATLGAGVLIGWFVKKKKQPEVESVSSPNPLIGKLEKTKNALLWKKETGSPGSDWDLIEEALLGGDVGASTAAFLIESAKKNAPSAGGTSKDVLGREMVKLLDVSCLPIEELLTKNHPLVISIVGINGAGKTTTIGKLAQYFKIAGKTVLLGAGDTFRAGAVAQLKTWADRVGVDFVTGREGADPGAVAFDAVTAGKA